MWMSWVFKEQNILKTVMLFSTIWLKSLRTTEALHTQIEVWEFTPEKLPEPKRKGAFSNHPLFRGELPKTIGRKLKIAPLKRKKSCSKPPFGGVPLLVFGGVNTIFLWHGKRGFKLQVFGSSKCDQNIQGYTTSTATYSGVYFSLFHWGFRGTVTVASLGRQT